MVTSSNSSGVTVLWCWGLVAAGHGIGSTA